MIKLPPVAPRVGGALLLAGEATGFLSIGLFLAALVLGWWPARVRTLLGGLLASPRRRVFVHATLSTLALIAALEHAMLLILARRTEGWELGLVAVSAMALLVATGVLQVALLLRIGYPAWRVLHTGLALLVLALSLAHAIIDGRHL